MLAKIPKLQFKVFQSVTHSFSEIVETLIVYFDTGGKTIYSGSFEHLDIREKGHFTFGTRCPRKNGALALL